MSCLVISTGVGGYQFDSSNLRVTTPEASTLFVFPGQLLPQPS